MEITVKEVFDELFKTTKFDKKLYTKILKSNISFITKNRENKNLFGSKLIGNHLISYTFYDKNIFFNELFDLTDDEVSIAIERITTINKSFKIARDSVNLTCFYIAHRFLSNKDLKEKDAMLYATEILNYFNYRTLIVISSNFFKYPISEEKAITLIERLSSKFLIKRLKNWKEYCNFRSEEYLKSKFKDLLITLNDDESLPNAISDLYNRTKDTMKNIFREFLKMNEENDIIKSKKAVVNDLEGKEVILDKLGNAESYINKVQNSLVSTDEFLKQEYIAVVVDIVKNVDVSLLEDTIKMLIDYRFKGNTELKLVNEFIRDIFVIVISHLQKNKVFLSSKSNIIEIMNYVVGNILYARGSNIRINNTKDTIDKLIIKMFKDNKRTIDNKKLPYVRNSLFIYIVIFSLLE